MCTKQIVDMFAEQDNQIMQLKKSEKIKMQIARSKGQKYQNNFDIVQDKVQEWEDKI